MLKRTPKSEKLDLRLTPEAKRRIVQAAAAKHCSVTDFVMRSAIDAADMVLMDQQTIFLNAKDWEKFQAALDAPPKDNPRLRRLMTEPSVFETQQLKRR